MPGYGYLNPSVPQPVGTGLIVGNALANAFQEGLSAFMQARRDKLHITCNEVVIHKCHVKLFNSSIIFIVQTNCTN